MIEADVASQMGDLYITATDTEERQEHFAWIGDRTDVLIGCQIGESCRWITVSNDIYEKLKRQSQLVDNKIRTVPRQPFFTACCQI